MKAKDFARLARQLLPDFPGMVVHGPMMLIVPVGNILRGLYFEGSSFDTESFYVWAYWLPLYVPTERIAFNLGKRVRGNSGERWNIESAQLVEELATAVRTQAVPFWGSVETLQGAVEVARQAAAASKDPYVHQAFGYSLAKAGNTQEAVCALEVLLSLLNPAVPWQATLGTRAHLLKERLATRVEDVAAMLEGWTTESIRQLGLEKIVERRRA